MLTSKEFLKPVSRKPNRRVVILLYNTSSDSFSAKELIERQMQYITSWKIFSPHLFCPPLLLISGGGDGKLPSSDQYETRQLSKRDINPLVFLYRSIIALTREKSGFDSFYFVAGTPLQPLAICHILKFVFPRSYLQVSIHGDLRAWFNPGLINYLKRNFLRISIPRIDLFRFVSETQSRIANSLFNLRDKRSVVCPIPLEIRNQDYGQNVIRRETVGFVGRVHDERGVREWIEITRRLVDFQALVVGDGPLFGDMKKSLPNANFAGKLSHARVMETYSHFSVLLSCAPYESYGLSIREALLSGVPVVTRNTVGVRELLERFPKIIRSYETIEEALNLIKELSVNPDRTQFHEFRVWIEQEQKLSLQRLVSNWG